MAGGGGLYADAGGAGFSTGVDVRLDPSKVAEVLRGPEGPVVRFMIRLGEEMKQQAQSFVGVKTGNLRDHIVKRIVVEGNNVRVEVGSDTPYTIYHHEGSDAVDGKLMVFEINGATVFTMRRRAIPPNRFLIRALDAARSLV